jgi:hypothetical protein
MIEDGDFFDKPLYSTNPILSSIPWISGFVLPVIPFCIVFHQNWFATFVMNIAFVYIFGPILTKVLLVRFASGKGIGHDMINALFFGLVFLTIGLFVR